MEGYWWECEYCSVELDFPNVTESPSISSFIWDKMLSSMWDQSLLTPSCKKCNSGILRITYQFPRKQDEVSLRVNHIVGLQFGDYLPMMWDTHFKGDPTDRCIDFKYQRGRNPWGLNKPALLSRKNLHALFECYRQKTGIQDFP
jgi:hypothetical protein